MQRERQLATENVLIDEVECAALDRAVLVDRHAKVTAGEQFFMQPAGLEGVHVGVQHVAAFLAGEQRVGYRIGSQHA